jgi:hypothetical protein
MVGALRTEIMPAETRRIKITHRPIAIEGNKIQLVRPNLADALSNIGATEWNATLQERIRRRESQRKDEGGRQLRFQLKLLQHAPQRGMASLLF